MPHLTTSERIGREIGRKETSLELLLSLGSKRFGKPDADTLSTLKAIRSADRLQELALRVLDVRNWQKLLS